MKPLFLILPLLIASVANSGERELYFLALENYYHQAGCADYKIINLSGATIDVREEIRPYLKCPRLIAMARDNVSLIYHDYSANSINTYNISTGFIKKIIQFDYEVEGLSNITWAPENPEAPGLGFLAFAVISKNGLPEKTRAFIWALDGGEIIEKMELDAPVNFHCGRACSLEPGKDFGFQDYKTFFYKRHISADENPGKIETYSVYTKK